VLDNALAAGYRHIGELQLLSSVTSLTSSFLDPDTAVVYRNEHHIGAALKSLLPKHNLKREDIFITSKLSK